MSHSPTLVCLILIALACSNNCPQPGGSQACAGSNCTTNGVHFNGDTKWKADVPNELADSSATATITAIFGFVSAPSSADTAEITSTGGSIYSGGIVLSGSNTILVTYPASKLIALAKSYTGSDIESVTLPTGITQNASNAGSGCGVLGS